MNGDLGTADGCFYVAANHPDGTWTHYGNMDGPPSTIVDDHEDDDDFVTASTVEFRSDGNPTIIYTPKLGTFHAGNVWHRPRGTSAEDLMAKLKALRGE